MDIIPAIDIIDGACVRLFKGDFEQKTVYNHDPVFQALEFERDGADMLHIVDLDGAKNGVMKNKDIIKKIRSKVSVPIEVGGGLRDEQDMKELFEFGINRIILGTSAVNDPEFLEKALKIYGDEKIAVGIDARKGEVAIKGWKEGTKIDVIDFAEELFKKGIKWIIYTDIYRDGTLTHPNFDDFDKLVSLLPHAKIIASGGVSRKEHIDTLSKIGVSGVIIGKALYEGEIILKEVGGKY